MKFYAIFSGRSIIVNFDKISHSNKSIVLKKRSFVFYQTYFFPEKQHRMCYHDKETEHRYIVMPCIEEEYYSFHHFTN